VPDRLGQQVDVRAGCLAQLGHRVDEGDLGREERVRGHLHQFGSGVVGLEERRAAGEDGFVDLVEGRSGNVSGRRVARQPVDQAVGRDRVLDGEALPEELGVPDEHAAVADDLGEASRRPHRDGGLPGDDGGPVLARTEVWGERFDRRVHVLEVCRVRVLPLRGPDGEEVDACVRYLGDVGGEAQSPRGKAAGEDFAESGFMERRLAGRQFSDLRRVDINSDDLVAEIGHARRVNGAEVAATENGDLHAVNVVLRCEAGVN